MTSLFESIKHADVHTATRKEIWTGFNPLTMAAYETDKILYDLTEQFSLGFHSHVLAVQHQFNVPLEAADRIVQAARPIINQPPYPEGEESQKKYFLQLAKEIGREPEVGRVLGGFRPRVRFGGNLEQQIRSTSILWETIYDLPSGSLEPIWRKRRMDFHAFFQSLKTIDPLALRDATPEERIRIAIELDTEQVRGVGPVAMNLAHQAMMASPPDWPGFTSQLVEFYTQLQTVVSSA